MNFGEQFKKIRKEKNLTQEQVAAQLHVSRQAVSNWENNKNLPDIEMTIEIAKVFHVSLDSLILGDDEDGSDSNMVSKLIKDGSETRRAKFNLVSICIGALLLIMGAECLIIKANTVECIDSAGILHENFFLLPVGFLFLFCGHLVIFASGISTILRNIVSKRKERKKMNELTENY